MAAKKRRKKASKTAAAKPVVHHKKTRRKKASSVKEFRSPKKTPLSAIVKQLESVAKNLDLQQRTVEDAILKI